MMLKSILKSIQIITKDVVDLVTNNVNVPNMLEIASKSLQELKILASYKLSGKIHTYSDSL